MASGYARRAALGRGWEPTGGPEKCPTMSYLCRAEVLWRAFRARGATFGTSRIIARLGERVTRGGHVADHVEHGHAAE